MRPGISLRDRTAALAPQRPLASNSEPYLRCMAEIEASFGPTAQRAILRERADWWAAHAATVGSVDHLRDLLVRHRSYWRREAGYWALRSNRLFIMIEVRKLKAARRNARRAA